MTRGNEQASCPSCGTTRRINPAATTCHVCGGYFTGYAPSGPQIADEYCQHGSAERDDVGVDTGADGIETCCGCGLTTFESVQMRRHESVNGPGAITKANGPTVESATTKPNWSIPPASRRQQANIWFITFCILTGLAALGSFFVTGNLLATTTVTTDAFGPTNVGHFNALAGFAGAVAAVVAWLPVVALFDYLRRGEGTA